MKLFEYPNHYVKEFPNNLILIENKTTRKKGIVSFKGDTILAPIYEKIDIIRDSTAEYNGHFIIFEKDKWGIANTQGKVILKPCLTQKHYNSHDFFFRRDWCPSNSIGILDSNLYIWTKQKKLLKINDKFSEISHAYENDTLILVQGLNWKYGLYNTAGKKMLEMVYEYIDLHLIKQKYYFEVKKDSFKAIIDLRNCREILSFPKQYSAMIYSNDYIVLHESLTGKSVLFDVNTQQQTQFAHYIFSPTNDRVWSNLGDTLTLFDTKGNKIRHFGTSRLEPTPFQGNISFLYKNTEQGEQYVCIDKNGDIIVKDTLERIFWENNRTQYDDFGTNCFTSVVKKNDLVYLYKNKQMAVLDFSGKLIFDFSKYTIISLSKDYWFLRAENEEDNLFLNSQLDTILKGITILSINGKCVSYRKKGKYYELGNENNPKHYGCIENTVHYNQLTPNLRAYHFELDQICYSSSHAFILTDNHNNVVIPDTAAIHYEYVKEGNVIFMLNEKTRKTALLDINGKQLLPFRYYFRSYMQEFQPWGFRIFNEKTLLYDYIGFNGIPYFEDTPQKE